MPLFTIFAPCFNMTTSNISFSWVSSEEIKDEDTSSSSTTTLDEPQKATLVEIKSKSSKLFYNDDIVTVKLVSFNDVFSNSSDDRVTIDSKWNDYALLAIEKIQQCIEAKKTTCCIPDNYVFKFNNEKATIDDLLCYFTSCFSWENELPTVKFVKYSKQGYLKRLNDLKSQIQNKKTTLNASLSPQRLGYSSRKRVTASKHQAFLDEDWGDDNMGLSYTKEKQHTPATRKLKDEIQSLEKECEEISHLLDNGFF